MDGSEMNEQARRNGYKENPNHSDARYRERDENMVKRDAFHSKEGYCGNFSAKEKDQMNGMSMPEHMKRRR
jgi:hypothetical protein